MENRSILLILSRLFSQGYHGVEVYTLGLAQELQKRGYHVSILHPEYDLSKPEGQIDKSVVEKIVVYKVNQHTTLAANSLIFRNVINANIVKYLVRQIKPDLIHFQEFHGFTATSAKVCSEIGIPILLTVHDFSLVCEQLHLNLPDRSYCQNGPENIAKCTQCYINRLNLPASQANYISTYNQFTLRKEYMGQSLKWIDTIISPSEFMINTMVKYGFIHSNFVCIPLGLKHLQGLSPKKVEGKIRFGFVGNLYSIKGIDLLIQAFNTLNSRKAQLDIYGNIPDEVYLNEVKQLIKPGSPVNYHGAYQPQDLPMILSQIDIGVIPSRFESYSLVAREFFQAKVPVIASNVGGLAEIVQDGINGLLFRVGDWNDLSQKMRYVLEDPGIIEKLRSNIPHIPTVQEEVDRIIGVYEKAILGKNK